MARKPRPQIPVELDNNLGAMAARRGYKMVRVSVLTAMAERHPGRCWVVESIRTGEKAYYETSGKAALAIQTNRVGMAPDPRWGEAAAKWF